MEVNCVTRKNTRNVRFRNELSEIDWGMELVAVRFRYSSFLSFGSYETLAIFVIR
jgi:hypothetical protein